jgi:hypothetical protein
MHRIQAGEEVYVRLVFQNAIPVSKIVVVFVHEDDADEHFLIDWVSNENEPLAPSIEHQIGFGQVIDTKPGVYGLERITFESYGGKQRDYQGDIELPRFEVIEESKAAPFVKEAAVLTDVEWQGLRSRERGF